MMRITLIAIGALKSSPLRELSDAYLKRLTPYAKIEVIEFQAESFYNPDQKEKAKNIEGGKIIKALSKYVDARIYVLDEKGTEYSSLVFAEKLQDYTATHLVFVIGGALGLSNELRGSSYQKLSLSAMTFPHEFARVLLLEQLYRAISIMRGKEYHY